MAKKRWVAILLTIVMLTTCLSPVHNALIHVAAAEETAAAEAVSSVANVDAAIEPNIVSSSDVSAEAVSASVQTTDNTSAVGNPSAAGKESAATSEPAPVSEPATPAAEEPVPASSSAETSTANTVSEPSNATQSSPVSPVAPAADEKPVSAEEPVLEKEVSVSTDKTAAASESSTPTDAPAEPSAPSISIDVPAETSEPSAPTEAPAETSEPSAPTEAPAETSEPSIPTETPAETSEPSDPTETPAETSEPSAPTEAPAETSEPSAPTEAPAETSEPSAPTETPAETSEPSAPTEAPAETSEPSAPTEAPAETSEPSDPTEAPAETVEPSAEPSITPEVTSEPTPAPAIPALNVSISMGPSYLMAGSGSLSATASFSGGAGDYQVTMRIYSPYSLENEKTVVMSEPGSLSLGCTPVHGGKHNAVIYVTDAAGQTAEAIATTSVSTGFPESPSVWADSVSRVQLTGVWNEDIIAIAQSQLGNREYESCFMVDEGGKPHYYTRYGHWFGSPYQDWCAMFVAFCLHHAGISTNDYPVSAGCTTWKNILTERDVYEKNPLRWLAECETEEEAQALWDAAYTPVSGDLVFFNRDGGEDPCHVGIVEYVEDGLLHTIEGNADNAVMRLVYDLTDETIAGYANTTVLAERAGALLEEDVPVTALPESTIGYTVIKSVNLRSMPTINSDQLAQLSQPGTAVTVLNAVEGNTLWYQVDYEGIVGYIRGDLLALEEPAETEAPEVTPEITPEPTVEPTYFCGLEVHVHNELCSDADGNITCELTVHEHDDSCLIAPEATPEPTVEPVYFCGLEVHVHDELCSDADGNITCELTVHEHDDSCLIAPEATPEPTVEPVYYCGLEVHVHDELCSNADGNIICELTVHEHDDSCLIAPEATPEPTVEPVYYCGLEVHIHDELCSDADGNITCELTVHEHDDNCLIAPEATPEPTVEPTYFCGLEVHVHDELCSDADGNITCELTVHEHDDNCLIAPEATPEPTVEPVYFCGLEVHVHDELCSDTEGNIICELTVHEHDDSCLLAPEATPEPTVEPVYYCGLEVHVHDELCSDADGNITCELTVHEHDDSCLIAPEATPEPTVEPVYFCGLEVHIHDELCSDADGNIICELNVHEHDDSCLIAPEATPEPTVEPVYFCGLEVHIHDELCSDAEGNIICELTVHEHDDSCLIAPEATSEPTVEPVYFCGLEAHVHDELCSDTDGNIICELTVHEHDETCLSPAALQLALTWDPLSAFAGETLVTLQAQVTGGVAPYAVQFSYAAPQEATAVLARSIEEPAELPAPTTVAVSGETATFTYQPAASGTHTLAVTVTDALGTQTQSAFSLQVAQPLQHETEADFLAAIAPAQLTGDARADIVAIAATQLGYTASATDFVVDDTGAQHAYTRYGAWAQQPYAPWSAPFVQFCLHYAGLSQTPAADAAALAQQMADAAQYRAASAYVPLAGDVVFFDWDEDGLADHTGLVANAYEGENGYTIETIEGDVDGAVITRMFVPSLMPSIVGFGTATVDEPQPETELPTGPVAEVAIGDNWMRLRDSGWFEEYSGAVYEPVDGSIPPLPLLAESPIAAYSLRSMRSGGDSHSDEPSDTQVDEWGGEKISEDRRVKVSKTIDGTELENVFDITLTVETTQKIEEVYTEPDMAVVIVMDISNTMNSRFPEGSTTTTRYSAAIDSADDFLDKFAAKTKDGSTISKVGYVAFNTSAHQIFGLSDCSTQSQADTLKGIMRERTGEIINNYSDDDPTRFTNVEAGLKMGYDLIKNAPQKNKYIIFLSDGFPTTYVKDGYDYEGYNPYYNGYGTPGTNGVFYDAVTGYYCRYGTSYSDKASIRAREQATTIKNAGVNIFSIGVAVGDQTIAGYDGRTNLSVIDRTGTNYEIGSADSQEAYTNWLKNSIGSGYYYDSTNSNGLNAAYDEIFKEIVRINEESSKADWVAEDPLPSMVDNGSVKTVEFISFFDKDGNLHLDGSTPPQALALKGTSAEGGEDTAVYDKESFTIDWDMKESGYTSTTVDNVTTYKYELMYRVRLQNEDQEDFEEKMVYPTNDTTTLSYKILNNNTISKPAPLEFPIPAVHGYLGELSFKKVDSFGNPVAGAELTLSHDTAKCSLCRGDGSSSVIVDDIKVSGADGMVHFTNIPSGHTYTLVETKIPSGYWATGYQYSVVVAYDETTVTITDQNGNPIEWDGTFLNHTSVALPETGGYGTLSLYTVGGLLILASASCLLYKQSKRRREGSTA